MATYQDLKGLRVKYLAADPANPAAGEVWYNSTTGTLKGVVSFRAYSSSVPLPSARGVAGSGGSSHTSGMCIGGSTPPAVNNTEEYNGLGWTAGGAWPTTKDYLGSGGPQTATLGGGGGGYPSACNTYDGTSWTSITAMPTGYEACRYAGTAATGLMTAGGDAASNYPDASHEWGGSSWTAGGSLPGPKNYGSNVAGTQTAAYSAGGSYPQKNTTSNYDGTSWTVSGNLPTNTYNTTGNTVGTQTSGVATGGNATGTFAPTVYHYDGSVWAADINSPLTYDNTGSSWGPQNAHAFAGGNASGATAVTVEYNISTNTITPAAWSSGGALTTPRYSSAGMGTQTAGLCAGGGNPSNQLNNSEEYNGTAWTEGDNLTTATGYLAAGGNSPQTAAVVFGGSTSKSPSDPGTTNVSEEYNGTSWTAGNNMTYSCKNLGGFGTQSSALAAGGNPPAPGVQYSTLSSEYDGTNWTAGTALPVGMQDNSGMTGASLTTGLLAGGEGAPGSRRTETLEYDGTTWTAGGSLATNVMSNGAAGIQTAAISYAGSTPTVVGTTEGYDGTAWSTRATMTTARIDIAAAGTSLAAFAAGGLTPAPGATDATEEFTGETLAQTASTLTTS